MSVKTIPTAKLVKLPTSELEQIVESDDEYDDTTWLAAEEELERRDYDDSDPAVIGARQDAADRG